MAVKAALQIFLRTVFTLLLAVVAAWACVLLHTPLPWMIGPLVATGVLSMLGAPTHSYTPLRNAGQWVIGAALGLYFTPQVVGLVLGVLWAIALNIVWALALGLAFGAWMHRVHYPPGRFHVAGLTRTTTYFAGPIGAASEMTLLGERYGAQTDLVASAHSLRVLLVTLIIPFGLQWAGLQGLDATLPGPRLVNWPGLALLAVLTGIGCWVMLKLRHPPVVYWRAGSGGAADRKWIDFVGHCAMADQRGAAGDRHQPGRAVHAAIYSPGSALAGLCCFRNGCNDCVVRWLCLAACAWYPAALDHRDARHIARGHR